MATNPQQRSTDSAVAAIQTYRSVYWIVFYADHDKPLLAGANWFTTVACASIALGTFSNLFRSVDKPSSAVGRFFDMGSGLWPTALGLMILGAGVYGLLVVANYIDDNYNWIFYAAEGGIGLLILKRTFTMKD